MPGVRFVFLRHGQATHNVAALTQGVRAYSDTAHRDAALTAEGVRQAWSVREAGRLGRIEEFTEIYCSPLRRCCQTLMGVMPGVEHRMVWLDDRLMEPQGEMICDRRAEMEEIRTVAPTIWNKDGVARINPYDVKLESAKRGEDGYVGFEQRVRDFTEDVLRKTPNGSRILVVAHHLWIRTWFQIYEPGRGTVDIGNCEWATATLPKS